jgi:branched-chain amino acid transport system ATP-binding protein
VAEGEAGSASALLRSANISKSFGGVHALDNVSFEVREGGITGLIGPNGAGKTTFFNCMTGFLEPDHGEVWFKGRRIDGVAPHRITRMGLVRTFQSIRMFAGLNVFESVLVAQHSARVGQGARRLSSWRRLLRNQADVDFAEEIIDLLGLVDVQNRRCTDLPLLSQRKVEVARAIACRPTMMLLDEPSAGSTVAESQELMHVIKRLGERSITLMVIEHNVPFVMGLCDEIIVLNFGKTVALGRPEEIADNDIVREIYLGARDEKS